MMDRYPAIALIEYSSIATGIYCGDAMVKRAPITVLKSGTVHQGKFLVLIGGSVAAVEESYEEGLAMGGDSVVDKVFLPFVHTQVHDAILGTRQPCSNDAVGVIETNTVAATIQSADAGVKGADITIVEIRLADDIGGKAIAVFNGKLEEVEAAVMIAKDQVTEQEHWLKDVIIPRIHADMAHQIEQSTSFANVDLNQVEGFEV